MKVLLVLTATLLVGCALPEPAVSGITPFGVIHSFVGGEPQHSSFVVPEGVASIHIVARFSPLAVGSACAPRLDAPPSIRFERPTGDLALVTSLDARVATGEECELASEELNTTATPGVWTVIFDGQGQALGSAGAS